MQNKWFVKKQSIELTVLEEAGREQKIPNSLVHVRARVSGRWHLWTRQRLFKEGAGMGRRKIQFGVLDLGCPFKRCCDAGHAQLDGWSIGAGGRVGSSGSQGKM